MALMLSCCKQTQITSVTRELAVGAHKFEVTIVYCDSCGSVKATSHVRELK